MKSYKKVAVTVILSVSIMLLVGCAASSVDKSRSEALLPEIDVVQVKENSDEALKLAQEAKLDVSALHTKLTENDNKLSSLSDEVSSVSLAKIEEIENRLSLLVEAYKELSEQIKQVQNKPLAAGSNKSQGPSTFSPSSATAVFSNSSEFEAYQNALKTFNGRTYDQALKLFTDVLNKFPDGSYVDNCHYWIGECYYAKGDYAQAIASFKKVIAISNSSKGDDAQFKLGLCCMKMGQNGMARTEFQKVLDRYPASEYVPKAKKYLAALPN